MLSVSDLTGIFRPRGGTRNAPSSPTRRRKERAVILHASG
jgi:hypothetical protein